MTGLLESIVWMTLNVYFEGRGESVRGQMDIVHVVHNRSELRNLSIKGVITQSKQFSWVNKDASVQRLVNNTSLVYDMIRCLKSVYLAEAERIKGDNRRMIDHYFNPDKVLPSWASKLTYCYDEGNHRFFTSVK